MTVTNDNDAAIIVTVDVNGQVAFDFDFLVYDDEELFVTYKPGESDEQELTLGADYTVDGVGNQNGGSIDITASGIVTTGGEQLLIYRSVPIKRSTDYAIELRAQALNREQDRSIMIMQELRRDVDRSTKAPIGQEPILIESGEDGSVPQYDADGNMTGSIPAADITNAQENAAAAAAARDEAVAAVSTVLRYPTIADAEAADPGFVPDFIEALGTLVPGDSGRLVFYDPTIADPGANVNKIFVPAINRWLRLAHEEGIVRFDKNAMTLDGSEETSLFEDTIAVALNEGLSRLAFPSGKSVELVDARLPEASLQIDFKKSEMLGNFNSNVAGASDRILRARMMDDYGTLIGDMTENGGLAAAFPGAFVQTASDGVTIIGSGLTAANSAGKNAASAYIGKLYSSPRRIFRATFYGSNDAGYATGADPNVTFDLYGKSTAGAPAHSTDGTLLGTLTFADSSNESATPREIISSNKTTGFYSVWLRPSRASGAGLCVSAIKFDGASPQFDLKLIDPVFNGRYNSAISLANERTGVDIWGYRNVEYIRGKMTGFGRGGVTPRIIFNRDVHHTRFHNCLNVLVDGYIQDANAAGEEIVVSSSDEITQYLIQRCRTINKISSGSSVSVYNCGPGQVLRNYVQSVSGSAFNLLTRNVECAYNDVLSTGSHGIDLSEGLIYSHGSWVHHNIVRGAGDAMITGCGNGLRIENNVFTGNAAWGVNSQSSQNLTGNFGSWCETVEHDIVGMKIKDNRSKAGFSLTPSGFVTNANVRVIGKAGAEYYDLEIDISDHEYAATKVDQNIWFRSVESAKISGKLMQGSEGLIRIDGQCGVIELDHVTLAPEAGQSVAGINVVNANLDALIINNSRAEASFDVGSVHIATVGTGSIDEVQLNNSATIGVASGGAGGVTLTANTRVLRDGRIQKRASVAHGELLAGARELVVVAMSGVRTTDDVIASIVTATALFVADCYVSTDNNVTLEIQNNTGSTVAAGNVDVRIATMAAGFSV